MLDLRMLVIRIRHSPPVRRLLSLPDRMDDAVLRGGVRILTRARPVLIRGRQGIQAAAVRCLVMTARPRGLIARGSRQLTGWLRRVPMSCWTGLLLTAMTVIPVRLYVGGIRAVCAFPGILPEQLGVLPKGSTGVHLQSIEWLSLVLMVLLPLAALAAFVRKRVARLFLKAGAAGFLLLVLFLQRVTISFPSLLNEQSPEIYPNWVRNEAWVTGEWRLVPWLILAGLTIFVLALRSVAAFYGSAPGETIAWADRLWANIRSNGSDPVFRKALYRSSVIHFVCIFLLPMLSWWGCNEMPYGVPEGSGTPTVEMVKIRKVKKKPEKKYVLNMNTAISFYVPKIEDSAVLEEVDKETENAYEAQQLGKLGAGGGKKGGWPNGMKNARVRFIRLEYDGGDWDQDMGYGADYNILLKFRELTGFDIASETESKPVLQLKRFPKNRAPPFVYMTGSGSINLSSTEISILREYCLNMGGLLFADNGGGRFDNHFRPLMRRVFPELPLVEISRDDVIFQQPFLFPAGAPPLWHHSGNEAMGIKYKGRWVVFYHQGDINDAWKTGHSGASSGVAMQAFKMGVNVMNYAFNQYMSINFEGQVPK